MNLAVKSLLICLAYTALTSGDESAVRISAAAPDEHGCLLHHVESPYQTGKTEIRVLRPEAFDPSRRYPVIYVLPVEAANNNRYGNGLLEVKKQNLHNKPAVLFVAPTFSHLPWYADHPTDPGIRQESYLLRVVLPFIDSTYPTVQSAAGRLLLGFSKSGWGAWSLLLRHPDVFGRAAAWDAPLMMDQLGKYGTTEIFGSEQNFQHYRITELLSKRTPERGTDARLILIGDGNFRDHHERMHSFLLKRNISHEYRAGTFRRHDWHSGWVAEALELLAAGEKR
jgi:S-formylglutathione hydrolase FrmB